jgi:nucleotide-binding universal stress UspA family protein
MTIKRKILIAVDGSDQALEAVRYISSLVRPELTEVVLFYVGSGFPEVFWDLNRNPLYQTKKNKVMGWLADQQLVIGEFNEKALKILTDMGFPKENILVKTQTKKTGVLKDIIQESYQGYSALVIGRTGTSRLKDLLLGGMAQKLAVKIKHIPVVVVGGKPDPHKILVALDESIEAMRGVSSLGALAGHCDCQITLCHCLNPIAIAPLVQKKPLPEPGQDPDCVQYLKNRFRPYMDEAHRRLAETGVDDSRISQDFQYVKGNIIQKMIETAIIGKYGTILVGRREAASFIEEHFRGRFGEKLIRSLENIAVWVVS